MSLHFPLRRIRTWRWVYTFPCQNSHLSFLPSHFPSHHGRRGLVMTRSAARGLQKKMHAACSASLKKERLGNRASNAYKSFRTLLLTGSWSHLVSRYAGLDLRNRTGGCFFFAFLISEHPAVLRPPPYRDVVHRRAAERLRWWLWLTATLHTILCRLRTFRSMVCRFSFSLSVSLSQSLSLSLTLSTALSPRAHTRQAQEGLTGCERELHEEVQVTGRCTQINKKFDDPASSVPGSGGGRLTAGCSQIKKA